MTHVLTECTHKNAAKRPMRAKTIVKCHLALALVMSLSSVSQASAFGIRFADTPRDVNEMRLNNLDDYAKRSAPKAVPPILHGDVEYLVVHWASESKAPHNGGYLEARDKKTGEKLWGVQVYTRKYDKNLETDVQDVFITEMKLDQEKGVLIVRDEGGRTFSVDINTRKVDVLKGE